MAKNNRIEIATKLGTLVAELRTEPGYPGIDILMVRDGTNGPEEVGLALAEVIETDEDTEATFHLRPYCASDVGSEDVNGYRISGRISYDAPMGDTRLTEADFSDYISEEA